uniref:Serpin domain-containing protein n=1 Tax=Sphenodon punctatus TaxID=8508 RepID=A0A8D0HPX9_SPHPU
MKSILHLCVLLVWSYSVTHGHYLHCLANEHNDHNDTHSAENKTDPARKNMACLKLFPINIDFAFRFYKQVSSASPSKNIFFAPVSISTAFAMLALGAKSDTNTQILEGLAFNLTELKEQEIHEGFQKLKPRQKFLDDAKNLYEAEVFTANFQNASGAQKQINEYAEEKTHGKIVELVNGLDTSTAMILVSYMFFKGKWEKPFEEEQTREMDFFVDEKTTVKVPMINRMGMFDYYYDKELSCTMVRLNYRGPTTAFFILPSPGKMKQVEEALYKETVSKWSDNIYRSNKAIYIPKFSISATLDLQDHLTKLGIAKVFTQEADLSGIAADPELRVSKAVHKAVLNIDESCSEATSATALEIIPMSLVTYSTLFIGKIVNPAGQ